MYSWENIRPGAWLLVVIQSKHHGDGDSGQPGPYIPFLTVWSGTFYKRSPCPGPGVLFCLQLKKQASTRMLGSVCTTFWLGNCWSDVASNVSLFFFLSFYFYFRTLNFSQLFNSSSTFKYIVGLSLKIEIRLCILCTVSLNLCTAVAVHQVCRSAGRVRRVACLGRKRWQCSWRRRACKWLVCMSGASRLSSKIKQTLPFPPLVCPPRGQGCKRTGGGLGLI